MIAGIPRVGSPTLMTRLGFSAGTEPVRVGNREFLLNLAQADADPDVEKVTVAEAIDRLTQALQDLPNPIANPARALTAGRDRGIRLAVEGLVENNMTPPPAPAAGRATHRPEPAVHPHPGRRPHPDRGSRPAARADPRPAHRGGQPDLLRDPARRDQPARGHQRRPHLTGTRVEPRPRGSTPWSVMARGAGTAAASDLPVAAAPTLVSASTSSVRP